MQIIGAGFGRSGTMSIKAALEELGYGPCYHMKITLKRVHHMWFFVRAWRGKKVNWKRFFRRYRSTVDWPSCSFYKDLMAEYPEAKVLLNVRDPEDWYSSMKDTIYAIQPAFPWWFPRVVRIMHNEIIWNGNLQGVFTDKEKAVRVYKEWIDAVIATVPADKLLVYNVKEGWGPLCSFLEVPVPKERPFPHINERRSFKRLILLLRILKWMIPLTVLLILTIFFICYF